LLCNEIGGHPDQSRLALSLSQTLAEHVAERRERWGRDRIECTCRPDLRARDDPLREIARIDVLHGEFRRPGRQDITAQ